MRALTKLSAAPGLELVDRPEPVCGPRDVKIRVLRAGLCGTDLHLQQWDDWTAANVNPPLIIGHEFYGEVVQVGDDVEGIAEVRVGDRVSGEGHVVCGHCRNCRAGRRHVCINTSSVGVNRDGAFADYVVIPASNAWVQPADLDPDLGAIFDPLGNATHTALQWPMVGEDVLITGAGPIGVMAAAIARHAGARYICITDVSDYRLDLALQAGADCAVNVARERIAGAQQDLGLKEGFDLGLEMSGNPAALAEMIDNLNHGARVGLLGIPKADFPINWGRVITHMITLKGIYGREMYDTWYAMSSMLQTSPTLREAVSSVITHRFPVEQWADAFATARSGECGKVVMDFS
ncbi:threonine 3-dehydrogenase [Kineosphaera limosa]|uniref:L-threonine 3-dehydrogenase n=1 Tax=Kineosphaera limosa NBRC 100340 TaxID=1184609 RepID=K6WQ64_9MICO|nr:L-threonine 3-dehydrogenase [Kineosphaera limosa]NYE01245.1 threonine 3-dehydrogenase [Kineosphaera limosa]GAB95956.1 L-threonine 3-dehydrogenase [Kineosphaera limosa NBRC 100340]